MFILLKSMIVHTNADFFFYTISLLGLITMMSKDRQIVACLLESLFLLATQFLFCHSIS
jgi:hypothetical protein